MKSFTDTFGEEFCKEGCMYRGPPPEGKLYQLTPEYQASLLLGRTYSVKFSSLKWLPDKILDKKGREKCVELLEGILSDSNSSLKLDVKVTQRNNNEAREHPFMTHSNFESF